jgi:enamine deaminase RidA (YjgF/YER057c/UK114 family)
MARRLISSGGPWEARYGYSRAVVVGDEAFVSGTTDAGRDGLSLHPGNPRGQAEAVFEIIRKALGQAGLGLADVVRTRMYVTDPANIEAVATVHGEVFGDIRPAATVVVVAALIDPTLLVEIEADARRSQA